jgi:hypothetical protein
MADLYDWSDLEKKERWRTLLLGNGMSINVSSRFDYSSLYDEAKERNLLASSDETMFELFSTKNFEIALSKLRCNCHRRGVQREHRQLQSLL